MCWQPGAVQRKLCSRGVVVRSSSSAHVHTASSGAGGASTFTSPKKAATSGGTASIGARSHTSNALQTDLPCRARANAPSCTWRDRASSRSRGRASTCSSSSRASCTTASSGVDATSTLEK
ncbi:hypothetical protein AB1Y20_017521 [Prymnesium parvum]|uniref:Uncharacterized protein n=1 Tax=Prymnesium parvum TaxID=97485 RepID=A0AB34JPM3_PRYPA